MAKPIFILKFRRLPSSEDERNLFMNELKETLKEIKEEYHILVIFEDLPDKGFDAQIFSDKEIEPIELEKLKEMIAIDPVKVKVLSQNIANNPADFNAESIEAEILNLTNGRPR